MPPESMLLGLAIKVRRFLEPHWAIWHKERGLNPDIISRWTYSRSSLFLHHVLEGHGIPARWTTGVRGMIKAIHCRRAFTRLRGG